jgi:hypothetical protein
VKNKILKSIIFIVMSFSCALNAQKEIVWFDAGLKAQSGISGLYNKAVLDLVPFDYELDFTSGYSFGGRFGINWENIGLSLEGMYANNTSAISRTTNTATIITNHNWKNIDLYPMLRNSKNMGYFEIGPKISLLKDIGITGNTADISSQYNKLNYSAVLGFGSNIIGNDRSFIGTLGIRIEYQVNDFVTAGDGKRLSAPLNIGSFYDQGYQSTHPLFIGLVFEANWGIGYYGRAKCGGRSKLIGF